MKTIKIKGRDYVTVAERVKEAHRRGVSSIVTECEFYPEQKMFVVKATVMYGDKVFTGLAYEVVGFGSNVNTESALENCETSAVGRALGFSGILLDDIASADEIAAVDKSKITDSQHLYIESLLRSCTYTEEMKGQIEDNLTEFSEAEAAIIIAELKEHQMGARDGVLGTQKQVAKEIREIL